MLKIKHKTSPRVPKYTFFYQAYTKKKKKAYVKIFKVTKNQDCKHSKQKTYFKPARFKMKVQEVIQVLV